MSPFLIFCPLLFDLEDIIGEMSLLVLGEMQQLKWDPWLVCCICSVHREEENAEKDQHNRNNCIMPATYASMINGIGVCAFEFSLSVHCA